MATMSLVAMLGIGLLVGVVVVAVVIIIARR